MPIGAVEAAANAIFRGIPRSSAVQQDLNPEPTNANEDQKEGEIGYPILPSHGRSDQFPSFI